MATLPPDPLVDRLAEVVGAAHVLSGADLCAPYETDWTRRWHGHARLVVRPGDTAEVAAVLAACAAGWDVEVDLAARDSATIGGMVATNAGGVHALRHGMMRARVAGIEAVLADGTVVEHLGGLAKDNTGYDLAGLLCGSEGTLAAVTRVRLRLVPRQPARVVALAGLGGLQEAVALLPRLRALPSLDAVEYADAAAPDLVRDRAGLPWPLSARYPAYLLVECATRTDPTTELAGALGGVSDVAVATDRPGREALWAWRERVTESVSAAGVPHKLDVSVPTAELGGFEVALRRRLAEAVPGPGSCCSGTSPTATSTSTYSARPTATPSTGRCCHGRESRRFDLGRARHRRREAPLAAPRPLARRDRRDARDQGRPRPGRHPQPRRPAPLTFLRRRVAAGGGALCCP